MKYLILSAFLFFLLSANAQNSCLTFNGTSQYVNVSNQPSLALSFNLTIEAWIYPTGSGSEPTEGGSIVNKENSYAISRFADGTIRYALSALGTGDDWGWINTGLSAPLNVWTHIALVKSGTTVTFYLNAAQSNVTTSNPATLIANTQDLRIGDRSRSDQFFQGNIDEVKVWNIARTQGQIKANIFNNNLSGATTGLIAYYQMNENTGTTTANTSTNSTGLDGTLVNSPTWTASPIQFGDNAISFDGSNDFVSISENSSLDITSAITLEAWVFATSTGTVQNVISKSNNSSNNGYIFPRTDDGWNHIVAYLHIAGGWRTYSAVYNMRNAWHHLAVTYDGATVKLYIDGVVVLNQARTGTITVNGNNLALGVQAGFSEFFGGSADELRVWNVARTQAQIQIGMAHELDPANETGLVAYYTANQGIAGGTNTGLTTLIDHSGNNNGTFSGFALTGATSNMVLQNAGITVLPLSWLDFTATQQQQNVLLNWSTAEEKNTSNFIAQHSADGSSWSDLVTVPAAGNSNSERDYKFTDVSPYAGNNFYRIAEHDLDGNINYSKVASVFFTSTAAGLMVYPNPLTTGNLNIKLPRATTVSLYSISGQLLMSKQMSPGLQQLNTGKLSKGIYMLKADDAVVRVVVQ